MNHELTPKEAAAVMEELTARARTLPPPTADDLAQRAARDAEITERTIVESLRASYRQRYDAAAPTDMRESDWNHPGLRTHRVPIQTVLQWQRGPKGIMAMGETGRGKTRSMWALMRRLTYEDGIDVRFYHAADWFAQLQEQISYGRDDAKGWVEAVARRPIVMIDDFGQEAVMRNREDWSMAWFFRFLDIRVGEKLPLFITTNMQAKDMAGKAGNLRSNPLIRRLLDVCDPVKF